MENNEDLKQIFIASNVGIMVKNPIRCARIIGPVDSIREYPKSKRSWFSWLGEGSGSSFDISSFATGLACGSCL